MQSPSGETKELSEIEVAQLERLIRRMNEFQRGELWCWLDEGHLRDCSLWDAVNGGLWDNSKNAERKKAGELIDIETCDIIWEHGATIDPYGDRRGPLPPVFSQVGRIYFVRAQGSDSEWIATGDLPEDKVEAFWKRVERERKAAGYDVHDLVSPEEYKAIAKMAKTGSAMIEKTNE
jgi:hypothetical protein